MINRPMTFNCYSGSGRPLTRHRAPGTRHWAQGTADGLQIADGAGADHVIIVVVDPGVGAGIQMAARVVGGNDVAGVDATVGVGADTMVRDGPGVGAGVG